MAKIVSLFVIPLLFSFATKALGQDAKLIDAAKKEGKVVVYGTLESDTIEVISNAFQKKVGIPVEYWRGPGNKVLDRALSEFRAGKPLFDVILAPTDPMEILVKGGVFAKYNSPSAADFPADAIDPNLGPRYRNIIVGIFYNKSALKPLDPPKSLEDLANPKYRGKIVMGDPTQHIFTTLWLASLDKVMGKEKADKFIRGLAAAKPIFVESMLPAATRVTAGETPLGISFIKFAFIFGKKGAPVDYVRLPGYLGDGHYIALSSKASHPNGGKAFIDFFLDDGGMKIMAEMGEFVNRPGVYPPLKDADKVKFVQMISLDKKGYADKKKEYQQIFFK